VKKPSARTIDKLELLVIVDRNPAHEELPRTIPLRNTISHGFQLDFLSGSGTRGSPSRALFQISVGIPGTGVDTAPNRKKMSAA
jgi:hypothetical protein